MGTRRGQRVKEHFHDGRSGHEGGVMPNGRQYNCEAVNGSRKEEKERGKKKKDPNTPRNHKKAGGLGVLLGIDPATLASALTGSTAEQNATLTSAPAATPRERA